MNPHVFWRMVWKEYRCMRVFWLTLALITVVLQAMVVWSDNGTPSEAVFALAAMLTACYGLGCGGTAFAGERESGTYGYLRSLPVASTSIFWGKLFYAVGSTALLSVFLWLAGCTYCWLRELPAATHQSLMWGSGPRTLELMLWAVLFSLLIARPLWAVVLAFVAGGISGELFAWLFGGGERPGLSLSGLLQSFLAPISAWRLLLLVSLLAADVFLARRWFREVLPVDVQDAARRSPRTSHPFSLLSKNAAWQRMFWQQWQSSRRMLIAAWVLYAAAVLVLQMASPIPTLAFSLLPPLALLTGFLGVLVFQADQRVKQFRFFAEQGISPRVVWWTRQAFWGLCLILSLATLVGLSALLHAFSGPSDVWSRTSYWDSLLASVGAAMLTYSAGQFCSLAGQRAVLVAAATSCLFLLMFFWCGVMIAQQVPFAWSVATIPLFAFFASWFLVEDWMLERRGWRSRLRTLAVTVGPALVLIAAVISYRWTEIPDVPVPLTPRQLTESQRQTALETDALYRQAFTQDADLSLWWADRDQVAADSADPVNPNVLLAQPPTVADDEAVARFAPSIQMAIEASRRPDCVFSPDDATATVFGYYALGSLIETSARQLQAEGKLDLSLENYMAAMRMIRHARQSLTARTLYWPEVMEHRVLLDLCYWASTAGQDAERIQRAMKQLDELYATMPMGESYLEWRHRLVGMLFDDRDDATRELEANFGSARAEERRAIRWIRRILPWEIVRAQRLLNHSTARDLLWLRTVQANLQQGIPLASIPRDDQEVAELRRWASTSLLGHIEESYLPGSSRDAVVAIATHRLATQLTLALLAWKWEQGAFPDSLDQLVGVYIDHVPIDPLDGKPFQFFAGGLDETIQWQSFGWPQLTFQLPAGAPLLLAPRDIPAATAPKYPQMITQPVSGIPYAIPRKVTKETGPAAAQWREGAGLSPVSGR